MQRRDFRRGKYEPLHLNPEDYSELPCRKRGTIQHPTIQYHDSQPITKPRTLSTRGYSVGQQHSTRKISILKDTSESEQSLDDDLMRHVQPTASWLTQLLSKKVERVQNKQQDQTIQQHHSLFRTICKEQGDNRLHQVEQSLEQPVEQVVEQPLKQPLKQTLRQPVKQSTQLVKQPPQIQQEPPQQSPEQSIQAPFPATIQPVTYYHHIQPQTLDYRELLTLLRLPRQSPVSQPIQRQISTFTFTQPPRSDLTVRYTLLQQILINIHDPLAHIQQYFTHVDQSIQDLSEQRLNIQQLRTFKKQTILQLSSVVCTAVCNIKQEMKHPPHFSNLLRYNIQNCACLILIKLSQQKSAQQLQKFVDANIQDESLHSTNHVYRIANNNNTISDLISKCMKELPQYQQLRNIVKNIHRRNVSQDYRQLRLLLCRVMDRCKQYTPDYLYEAPCPYLHEQTNKVTLLIYIDNFIIVKHEKVEVRAHAAQFLVSLSKQFQIVTYSVINQEEVDTILDQIQRQVGMAVISQRLYRYHGKDHIGIDKLGRTPDKLLILMDRGRTHKQSQNIYFVNVWKGRQGSLMTRQLHDIIGRLQGQLNRPREANHQRRRSMK